MRYRYASASRNPQDRGLWVLRVKGKGSGAWSLCHKSCLIATVSEETPVLRQWPMCLAACLGNVSW
jgi:hypothetical protein